MQRIVLSILLLLPVPLSAEEAILELDADTPVLGIETRPDNRNFMRLPDLIYQLRATVQCPANTEPSSLSVAIADTRVALGATEIITDTLVEIEIPASQIGPLAVGDFCTEESDNTANLAVDSLLSAQGALHCQGASNESVTYASVSLPVELECQSAETTDDAVTE